MQDTHNRKTAKLKQCSYLLMMTVMDPLAGIRDSHSPGSRQKPLLIIFLLPFDCSIDLGATGLF